MDPVAGILLGIGLLIISGMTQLIRGLAGSGQLERNSAVGIRTRATMYSDAAWQAGHRAAGPWLLAGTVTGSVAATVGICLSALLLATDNEGAGPLIVSLAGYVAVLTILVMAVRRANSASRSISDRP